MTISEIIKNYRTSHGLSLRDFAKSVGVSHSYISQLEKGEIRYPSYERMELIAKAMGATTEWIKKEMDGERNAIKVPVLGKVIGGLPIEASQEIIDYEEITKEMAKTGEFFALKVKGDSMSPEISEGDVVIVKKQSDVDSGQVAIVLVNGNEATIKRVKKLENGIMMIPFNQTYSPWAYTAEEIESLPVQIIGRVVECRKKY